MALGNSNVIRPRLSVRETQYPGGRVRLEAFYNHDGVTIATCDLDAANEEVGIELLALFHTALRQRHSGVILPAPGTKVG